MAALARRARLFVASDTGPLHLAVAVGTPSIGLFGPMPAERNGPYGADHIALQKMQLSGGSRQRRTAGPESMLAISVADVCQACDELLSREVRRRDCA
jgi:ADP-heptose:LPS heptosyltransferase